MSYAVVADMTDRFGERELISLTDNAVVKTGAINTARVLQAIADADSEIDGYLQTQYDLPLVTVPVLITRLSCDIARYRLHSQVEIAEAVAALYENAVAMLRRIARGEMGIAVTNQSETAVKGTIATESRTKKFSDDVLDYY